MNWQSVLLGDEVDVLSGYAWKASEFNKEGYGLPIIRIQNVDPPSQTDFVYWDGGFDNKFIVDDGDILLTLSGSFRIGVWDLGEALLNQRVVKLTPSEKLDKTFFLHFMRTKLQQIEAMGKHALVNNVSISDLKHIEVPLPALSEQKRIAAILEKADAHRAKRRAALARLDTLLQATFLDMFGDPVINPMGWPIKRLDDVGTLERGKSKHRPRNAPELLGGPYPLVQTGDIANAQGGYLTQYSQTYSALGLKQSKMWEAGVLCITIAANIANAAILTFDACFPDSVVGFLPNKYVHTEYVQYWLLFLKDIIEEKAPQSSQKNINLGILRELELPVPPIELQKKFVQLVEKVSQLRNQHVTHLVKMDTLFQALQNRVFKGELTTPGEK